ncbi:MAG: hypothetical protein AB7S99_10375 [Pseudodonghicola sp.]
MRPHRAGLLALLLALWAGGVAAQDGRALFTGRAAGLEDAGAERRLARFPCHSCHGRDGLGGVEGDVPPVEWALLAAPSAARPGYDAASFHRAVTEGVAADGRELSRLMPRYALSRSETAGLRVYLETLHAEQRRGVTAGELRIGVARLPGAAELSDAYRAALRAAVVERLGGEAVYGRRLVLVPVDPAYPERAEAVLAVLGLPVAAAPAFAARGIPVLAPLGALSGDEDVSILRGITPSQQAFHSALAREIAGTGAGDAGIAILAEDPAAGAALQLALSLAAPGRPAAGTVAPTAAGDIVALGGAGVPPLGPDWNGRLWITWQSLAARDRLPAGGTTIVALETPRILTAAMAQGVHPALIHARAAGIVLAEALKAGRRDLTRAGLLRGLGDTVLGDIGLDYDRFPLTGTEEIVFIPLR